MDFGDILNQWDELCAQEERTRKGRDNKPRQRLPNAPRVEKSEEKDGFLRVFHIFHRVFHTCKLIALQAEFVKAFIFTHTYMNNLYYINVYIIYYII